MKMVIRILVLAFDLILAAWLITAQRKTTDVSNKMGQHLALEIETELQNPKSLGRYKNGTFVSSQVIECIEKWSDKLTVSVTTEKGTWTFPGTDTLNLVNSASDAYLGEGCVYQSQIAESEPYWIHFSIKTVNGVVQDPTAATRRALALAIGDNASEVDSFSVLLSKFQAKSLVEADKTKEMEVQVAGLENQAVALDNEIQSEKWKIQDIDKQREEAQPKENEVAEKRGELGALNREKETVNKQMVEEEKRREEAKQILALANEIYQKFGSEGSE